MPGLIGKKVGMTRIFNDEGVQVLKDTGDELDDVKRKSKATTSARGRGFKRMQTQV